MKKVEADRLLDLHGTALRAVLPDILDPDIATAPEIFHVLLLRPEQLLEPLSNIRSMVHSARPQSSSVDAVCDV